MGAPKTAGTPQEYAKGYAHGYEDGRAAALPHRPDSFDDVWYAAPAEGLRKAARNAVEPHLMRIVNRTKPMDQAEGLAILADLDAALQPAAPAEGLRDEDVARLFHEAYERLAPSFGYETRKASAVPWENVPENNRRLMIAVAGEVRTAQRLAAPAEGLDVDAVESALRSVYAHHYREYYGKDPHDDAEDFVATYAALAQPAAPAEGLFTEAEAPRSTVSLVDEWIALTDPPEITALNVRGLAVWLDLKRKTQPAAPAEGLDVERLTEAIYAAQRRTGWDLNVGEGWLAEAIAREYAALGPTADTVDALNTTNATP